MSDMVIHVIEQEGSGDLRAIVDAFAKEMAASRLVPIELDAGLMMQSSTVGGLVRRKLIFGTPGQAIRFLAFWRSSQPRFRSLVGFAPDAGADASPRS